MGRDTLERAVASAADADEVIVIRNQDGDRGYKARTQGMAQAAGTHLCFLDDDDVYTPGAIAVFREHACDRPAVGRMQYKGGGVLWSDPVLRYCNVGTPMICVPNDPARLGAWRGFPDGSGGDYRFLEGCVRQMGEPVWIDHIVALVSPDP